MAHYETKLKDLYLDHDTSAIKYIKIWIVCLEARKVGGLMERVE